MIIIDNLMVQENISSRNLGLIHEVCHAPRWGRGSEKV